MTTEAPTTPPARARRRAPSEMPFGFADRPLAERLSSERGEPDWLREDRLAAAAAFEALPVESNQLYTPYIDLRAATLEPRVLDAAAREALACAALTLVVVPAEVRATAAAARVCASACAVAGDVRVVVRGPAPSGLTAAAVAEVLGLPLAGYLRPEPGLVGASERGDPPGRRPRSPMARLCNAMIDDLVGRPAA